MKKLFSKLVFGTANLYYRTKTTQITSKYISLGFARETYCNGPYGNLSALETVSFFWINFFGRYKQFDLFSV